MATEIERLIVTLEASTKQYERALAKAQGTTISAMRKIERDIAASGAKTTAIMGKLGAQMGASFQNALAGSLRGLGGSLLGMLGVDSLIRGAMNAVKAVAELGDQAADLGIAAGELQVWNRMAIESGQSAEIMARGLSEVAEQSQKADSKMSKLFATFGRQTTGNATQDLLTLMNILEKMPEPAAKLAALSEIFGEKLGRRLAETLTQTANKYFETDKAMTAAGEKRTDAEIKNAREIDAAYNVLTDKLVTIWQQATLSMISSTEKEIELLKQAWAGFETWWGRYVDELWKTWNSGQPNAIEQMFGGGTTVTGQRGGSGASNLRGKQATPEQRSALEAVAAELGISAQDLATAIAYETGGTMSPSTPGRGAAAGRFGLIQFGPNEAAAYGAAPGQNFTEQMQAVKRYLKARGLQPGSSLLDIYSTINAGSPGRYGASDVPGKTVTSHVASMGPYATAIRRWLEAGQPIAPGLTGSALPPGHVNAPGYAQATVLHGRKADGKADDSSLYDKTESNIKYLQRLYEAQKKGDAAYDETESNIAYLSRLYEEQQKQLKLTTDATNQYYEALSSTLGSALSGFVDDLMNGVEAGEAFSNMLKRLASQLAEMAIQNLFSAGGKPGGLAGVLLGGLGGGAAKVPGLQHGGSFRVGGSGGTDSSLVAFRATPGELVTVTPQRLRGRGGGGANVSMGGTVVHINGNADNRTVALLDRRIQENNYRQRQALHREWGDMSVKYNQLRSP